MSEEQEKITTIKKEKDPKRVLAGVRLAKIGREAHNAKAQQKLESESNSKEWNINYSLVIGVLGVSAAIGAYYARKDDAREMNRLKIKPEDEPKEYNHGMIESKSNKTKPVTLDSLD
jgi:hypothetical protein